MQDSMADTVAAVGQEAARAGSTLAAWAEALGLAGPVAWLSQHPLVSAVIGLALLSGAAWVALAVVRRYVLRIIEVLVRRSPTSWDEVLLDRALFQRLAWAVPVFVIYQGIEVVPFLPTGVSDFIKSIALASYIIIGVRALSALLSSIGVIYNRFPIAATRPIKGYLQVVSVVAHFLAGVLLISTLLGQDPLILLGGMGAMTAVLLLIFRDTILSLVAGIQLTGNDLIRVGDWIEMPQFEADGDVVDIALNSVRVQNWDRTFTVIPTHKFLEHSFRNWRGMQESGGRRIKRSFNIDVNTIRFLGEAEVAHFGKFVLIREYVERKVAEIEEYNREHAADPELIANARRLTNMGMLRAYVVSYLRQHPKIHQRMTFLVRQLEPTAEGLPLEIYVFTNDTAWANYEAIQADIFDHILAMVPEFGLGVYQAPSGRDLALLSGGTARRTIPAANASDADSDAVPALPTHGATASTSSRR